MKTRKIGELRNWDKNPRGIKQDAFNQLKERIKRWGQFKPVVITPDGEVIGGNMRLRAYKELGIEDIWVSVVEPKNEAEKIEIALSDNEELGYYEEDQLAELISTFKNEINLGEYHIHLGKLSNLQDLLDQYQPTDIVEDEVPELPKEPKSKYGEVYELGRHRLMCGDSTKIEDVEKLMNGQKADMVFTDPPYGMSFDGAIGTHGEKRKKDKLMNDSLNSKENEAFLDGFITIMRAFNKGAFYISYWRLGIDTIMNALTRNGLRWRNLIIWKKNNFNLSNSDYKSFYEPIVFGWEDDYEPVLYGWVNEHLFFGKKGETDVWELPTIWEIDKTRKNTLHSTMKPVNLCARAIRNSSVVGGSVLDLFGGSGSTLIACEQLDRTCYMMELDPKYCDVIRERYDNFKKDR